VGYEGQATKSVAVDGVGVRRCSLFDRLRGEKKGNPAEAAPEINCEAPLLRPLKMARFFVSSNGER
jgi:hypothetical protein